MKNISSTASFSQNVKRLKANYSKESGVPLGQQVSEEAKQQNEAKATELTFEAIKKQNNKAVLQASVSVSVGVGNEPLALLYKTAIKGINDVLKADFGDNAIATALDSGIDASPQATADRIVSMSTAFFTQYQEQNADMSTEEAVKSFVKLIGGGVDQGFSEARDVLKGLKVLDGDIASNIDTTYNLVQKGLQAFVDNYNTAKKEPFAST